MFRFKTALGLCLLFCSCAGGLFGQAGNGGITGAVRDASGSPVPNATVTVATYPKASGATFKLPALVFSTHPHWFPPRDTRWK